MAGGSGMPFVQPPLYWPQSLCNRWGGQVRGRRADFLGAGLLKADSLGVNTHLTRIPHHASPILPAPPRLHGASNR